MGAKHRLRIYLCGDVWVNKLSVFHDQIYSYPHSTSLSVIDIYMCRCTIVDFVSNYSILVETIPINIHIFTCMGVSLNGATPNLHPKMIIFGRKTHSCWGNPAF